MNFFRFPLFCIIIFSSTLSFGQSLNKAFKKLEKLDLEKAEILFKEIYLDDDNNVGVHFGLAQIYSSKGYDKFDLFKSYYHISRAKKYINDVTGDELSELMKYVNPDIIDQSFINIDQSLKDYILKTDDPEFVSRFIAECPDSKYLNEVITVRDKYEFNQVIKSGKISAFNEFIEKYPMTYFRDSAVIYRDGIAFERVYKSKDLIQLMAFLDSYPLAWQVSTVIAIIDSITYINAVSSNSIEKVNQFITKNPNSKYLNDAIEKANSLSFNLSDELNTIDAYNRFIETTPNAK